MTPEGPHLGLSVGGLDFLTRTDEGTISRPDESAYRPFVTRGLAARTRGQRIDVRLEVRPEPAFDGQVIFQSSASWSIRARGAERGIVESGKERALYAAHLRPGSPQVVIQCSPELVDAGPPRAIHSPLHYPLDQLLVMYLLGESGLIVHAAGMVVHGRGVVLAGVSGAGKTTFARLVAGRSGWAPLSDDRVIVSLAGEVAAVHGTPWPGEGEIAANDSGPLSWLLFLEQGDTNSVRPLDAREALARLLMTTSVPWYDKEYVGNTLEACGRLVRTVPCRVLTFRADVGAVKRVEALIETS